MNEIVITVLFLISGYFTGILIGMLGIGGGIAFVPLLYLLLPYTAIDKTQIAYIVIATSLFAGMFGTLSSARKHFIFKNIEIKKALILASGSTISSFISPVFAVSISPQVLQIIFAVIFLSLAVKMLLENRGTAFGAVKDPLNNYLLFAAGLFVGSVTGLAGIAGGILFVPILVYLFLVDLKKAIGTSSMVTVFTTVTSTISFALLSPKGFIASNQIGYIYLVSGIPLGIGSAFGALNGAKFLRTVPADIIKKIFSAVLIVVVLKIILGL